MGIPERDLSVGDKLAKLLLAASRRRTSGRFLGESCWGIQHGSWLDGVTLLNVDVVC